MIGDDSWVPPIDRNSGALFLPCKCGCMNREHQGQILGVPSTEAGQAFTTEVTRSVWQTTWLERLAAMK